MQLRHMKGTLNSVKLCSGLLKLLYIFVYKLKSFGQFLSLKMGIDLYASLKICRQPPPR